MDDLSNGNKAWEMLVKSVDRLDKTTTSLDVSVTGLRGELAEARRVAAVQEVMIKRLPCNEHTDTLRELRDAVQNKLSLRALLTQILPALVVGAAAGSRFL